MLWLFPGQNSETLWQPIQTCIGDQNNSNTSINLERDSHKDSLTLTSRRLEENVIAKRTNGAITFDLATTTSESLSRLFRLFTGGIRPTRNPGKKERRGKHRKRRTDCLYSQRNPQKKGKQSV